MMEIDYCRDIFNTIYGNFGLKDGKLTLLLRCEDKYGNVVDNENRTYTNAAGKTTPFDKDADRGMVLNNGEVAFTGNYGMFEVCTRIVNFETSKFQTIDGYFNTNTCLFYNDSDEEEFKPNHNPLGMVYFSTHFYENNFIMISTLPNDATIVFNGKANKAKRIINYKFAITTYLGNDLSDNPILFEVNSHKEAFPIYMFRNFILTEVPIDDMGHTNYIIKRTFISATHHIYEIKSGGKHTKMAARLDDM
jgi:hypothetical protein